MVIPFLFSCEEEKENKKNSYPCEYFEEQRERVKNRMTAIYELSETKIGNHQLINFREKRDELIDLFMDMVNMAAAKDELRFYELKNELIDIIKLYLLVNEKNQIAEQIIKEIEQLRFEIGDCEHEYFFQSYLTLELMMMKINELASNSHCVFKFDTIETLAFSNNSEILEGDSIVLNIKVAAYDSYEYARIRYWLDDTSRMSVPIRVDVDQITLSGSKGFHYVDGDIAVEEKGVVKWKPWRYRYEVK